MSMIFDPQNNPIGSFKEKLLYDAANVEAEYVKSLLSSKESEELMGSILIDYVTGRSVVTPRYGENPINGVYDPVGKNCGIYDILSFCENEQSVIFSSIESEIAASNYLAIKADMYRDGLDNCVWVSYNSRYSPVYTKRDIEHLSAIPESDIPHGRFNFNSRMFTGVRDVAAIEFVAGDNEYASTTALETVMEMYGKSAAGAMAAYIATEKNSRLFSDYLNN